MKIQAEWLGGPRDGDLVTLPSETTKVTVRHGRLDMPETRVLKAKQHEDGHWVLPFYEVILEED
jgi:hypothetical protein